MVDVRDLNGYRKGEREVKQRREDDGEMEAGMVNEQKRYWKISLQWGHCPSWIRYLAPAAALWFVIQEKMHLVEDGGWLLLAGMLWTGIIFCVSLLKFLYQFRKQYKQKKVSETSEIVEQRTGQRHQACLISKQDAVHLLSMVRALLDGLVVSLLQEPLSDPRVSQIQGLLNKLEAVYQLIIVAVNNSFLIEERLLSANNKEDKVIKTRVEDRVKHICTYLQERVSALHFLLQTQDQYGVCIVNVQQELQGYWELLEDLHNKVTLQPEKCQGIEDPHTVLTDTEGLYTKLGLFQRRIHECQELENRQQDLAQTIGLTLESTWTKDLLQCNTQQFKKVFKDFTCLEQQTLTFVMHLQDLSVTHEKNSIKISDVEHVQSSLLSPSSLPVYRTSLATGNTPLDPDPRPTLTPSSKFSVINLLCGLRQRRSPRPTAVPGLTDTLLAE
ncbi:uncharacterized protein si:ch211-151h10.2 isoform X3 [Ictalurus punctatus]|uniref:Uncharacterized protein si:ch211-151h10.2 isoform X3 n=1 Tax=Ictalurus punctatus TaxID=7998 RepID=A0A9F7TE29_ICTPU|nr:uncharacterized protein si:ch211-151h10.2 isoform X3 [Ictalurus punctatus]